MANRARSRLLVTGEGTRSEAFGPTEWALLAGVATIWGSSFPLMEIGLQAFQPGLIAFLRIAFGAGAVALVPAARRVRIDPADRSRIWLLGATWLGLPLLMFPIAQQWIDSSVAGMINGAVPLSVAAWSRVLLRRRPREAHAVGLALGFLGIVAVSLPQLPVGPISTGGTSETALGMLLLFGAVVLYGLSANLAVPLQQQYGSLPILLGAQIAALPIVTPVAIFSLRGSTFEWGSFLAMVPLGILGTGLAFALMATLVGRVGSVRGSVATYFIPVVAIALGVLLLGEPLHPVAVAGMGMILCGAWITSRRERQPAESP